MDAKVFSHYQRTRVEKKSIYCNLSEPFQSVTVTLNPFSGFPILLVEAIHFNVIFIQISYIYMNWHIRMTHLFIGS